MSPARTGERSKKALARVAAPPAKANANANAKAKPARPAAKAAKPAKPGKKVAAKSADADADASFEKISALCLALPGTKLTMPWGSPHFRVRDKIFCGFGVKDGKQVLSAKLRLEHAQKALKDARFWPSPYVGKHGWVSFDVARRKSWDEVAKLIRESYELIAPKALLAELRGSR